MPFNDSVTRPIKAQEPIVLPSTKAFLPTSSWWCQPSREAFTQACQDQTARMKQSTFGRAPKVISARDTEQVDRS